MALPALLLILLGSAAASNHSGFISCPCVGDVASQRYQLNDTTIMVPTAHGVLLYPKEYGGSCSMHDLGQPPYCENYTHLAVGQADPYNCMNQWCYVSHQFCDKAEFFPSEYFEGAHYSYHTCMLDDDSSISSGERNEFRVTVASDTLKGKAIRFSYPKDSPPWHYREKGRWTGLMHRLFEDIAFRGGFTIEYVEPNNFSYGMMGSNTTNTFQVDNPWDACTHSVMMGYIDVCPTAAWETPNRRDMSLFAAAVLTSNFRLMVRQHLDAGLSWDPQDGYGSVWFTFMKPFSMGLWGALMGTTVFAGLSLWAAEKAYSERKLEDGQGGGVGEGSAGGDGVRDDGGVDVIVDTDSKESDTRNDAGKADNQSTGGQHGTVADNKHDDADNIKGRLNFKHARHLVPFNFRSTNGDDDAMSLFGSIYYSVFGLFVTDVPHDVSSPGGKLLKVFYAFLIVIAMNSYTANLATTMLMQHQEHIGIQGVEECYDGASAMAETPCRSVCLASQIEKEVLASHPKLSATAVIYPSSTAVLEAFKNGDCDASVVPDHDVKARADFQVTMREHKFMLVGDPLFTMTVGTPVGKHVAAAYSQISLTYHYEGGFQRLWDVYAPKNILPNYANDVSTSTSQQMDITHMMGLFCGFGISVVVAGSASLLHVCATRRRRRI